MSKAAKALIVTKEVLPTVGDTSIVVAGNDSDEYLSSHFV